MVKTPMFELVMDRGTLSIKRRKGLDEQGERTPPWGLMEVVPMHKVGSSPLTPSN